MKPTSPQLLKRMQKKARATDFGAPAGRWGVEKAARARLAYEREGGRWAKPTKADVQKRAADLQRRKKRASEA